MAESAEARVTHILSEVKHGDDQTAIERLLPIIYNELRQLAASRLTHEKAGQTLQATALVHEAYLRLVRDPDADWRNRGHFFAAAAEAMRRILIEQARRKATAKHGGDRARVDLNDSAIAVNDRPTELLALNEALDRLEAESPHKARLVKLRYFGGLTIAEAARAMNISHATAERYWAYSRLRLFEWMESEPR